MSLLNIIASFFKNKEENITKPIEETVEPIKVPVANTIQQVSEPVEKIIIPVQETIEPIKVPVANTVQQLPEPVEEKIIPVQETFEPIKVPVANIIQQVSETIKETVEPIKEPVASIIQHVPEPIEETIEPITEPVSNNTQKILDSTIKLLNTQIQPETSSVNHSDDIDFVLEQEKNNLSDKKASELFKDFMFHQYWSSKNKKYRNITIQVNPVVVFNYCESFTTLNQKEILSNLFGDEFMELVYNYERPRYVLSCAGFQYHKANKVEQFIVGDEVTLLKDPTNKKDKNAIKIIYQNYHIGFIPREYTDMVQKLIKKNPNLTAEIFSYEEEEESSYHKLKIRLILNEHLPKHPFFEKKIAFGGELETLDIDALKILIADVGGKYVNTISELTDYFVRGKQKKSKLFDIEQISSKEKKAIDLGTKIIDEIEFLRLIINK